MAAKVTASEVVAAVRRRYGCETDDIGPEWAALAEMDLQPGFSTQRIDLLLVRAWRSRPAGHERHAVEVKVSRQDLRRELEAGKWRPWAAVTHRFFLAVPAAVNLDGLALPDEWGVLRVDGRGTRLVREAPRRDAEPLPEACWVEGFRRASRAEARIRQADVADPAARIADLERQVVAEQRRAVTARQAEDRSKRRLREALQVLMYRTVGLTCERCGVPVELPSRAFRGQYLQWAHAGGEGGVWLTRGGEERPCEWPSPDLDELGRVLAEQGPLVDLTRAADDDGGQDATGSG